MGHGQSTTAAVSNANSSNQQTSQTANEPTIILNPIILKPNHAVHISPPDFMKSDGNLMTNWRQWKQNFEIYLRALGIDSNSERACNLFLHTIGQYGRDIFNILDISKPYSLQQFFRQFEQHCNPSINTFLDMYKFFTTKQTECESFELFLQSLRQSSSNCQFGMLHNDLLLVQILSGITNCTLKERLLNVPNLTLSDVIAECRNSELASTAMHCKNIDNVTCMEDPSNGVYTQRGEKAVAYTNDNDAYLVNASSQERKEISKRNLKYESTISDKGQNQKYDDNSATVFTQDRFIRKDNNTLHNQEGNSFDIEVCAKNNGNEKKSHEMSSVHNVHCQQWNDPFSLDEVSEFCENGLNIQERDEGTLRQPFKTRTSNITYHGNGYRAPSKIISSNTSMLNSRNATNAKRKENRHRKMKEYSLRQPLITHSFQVGEADRVCENNFYGGRNNNNTEQPLKTISSNQVQDKQCNNSLHNNKAVVKLTQNNLKRTEISPQQSKNQEGNILNTTEAQQCNNEKNENLKDSYLLRKNIAKDPFTMNEQNRVSYKDRNLQNSVSFPTEAIGNVYSAILNKDTGNESISRQSVKSCESKILNEKHHNILSKETHCVNPKKNIYEGKRAEKPAFEDHCISTSNNNQDHQYNNSLDVELRMFFKGNTNKKEICNNTTGQLYKEHGGSFYDKNQVFDNPLGVNVFAQNNKKGKDVEDYNSKLPLKMQQHSTTDKDEHILCNDAFYAIDAITAQNSLNDNIKNENNLKEPFKMYESTTQSKAHDQQYKKSSHTNSSGRTIKLQEEDNISRNDQCLQGRGSVNVAVAANIFAEHNTNAQTKNDISRQPFKALQSRVQSESNLHEKSMVNISWLPKSHHNSAKKPVSKFTQNNINNVSTEYSEIVSNLDKQRSNDSLDTPDSKLHLQEVKQAKLLKDIENYKSQPENQFSKEVPLGTTRDKSRIVINSNYSSHQQAKNVGLIQMPLVNWKKANTFGRHTPDIPYASKSVMQCLLCNLSHRGRYCPANGKKCAKCGKYNHYAIVCGN